MDTVYLSDFQGLGKPIENLKMNSDDEVQVLILLSSLPNSWETLVVSLNNSAP